MLYFETPDLHDALVKIMHFHILLCELIAQNFVLLKSGPKGSLRSGFRAIRKLIDTKFCAY